MFTCVKILILVIHFGVALIWCNVACIHFHIETLMLYLSTLIIFCSRFFYHAISIVRMVSRAIWKVLIHQICKKIFKIYNYFITKLHKFDEIAFIIHWSLVIADFYTVVTNICTVITDLCILIVLYKDFCTVSTDICIVITDIFAP